MSIDVLPPDGGIVVVPGGGMLIAGGLAVPADGSRGFASACIFHHIDGSAGTMLYLNEGTVNSCAFKRVVTAARFSAITVQEAFVGTSNYAGSDTVNASAIYADVVNLYNKVDSIVTALRAS